MEGGKVSGKVKTGTLLIMLAEEIRQRWEEGAKQKV